MPTSVRTVSVAAATALLVGACAAASSTPVGPGTTATTATTATTTTTAPAAPLTGLAATSITDDLDEPVAVIPAPDGERLWVLERAGRVVSVDPAAEDAAEVVLDLTDEVGADGPEQGLLSIGLHPGYPELGGAFVYLVTAGDDDTELREYRPYDDEPDVLDPASAELVLAVEQPHEWHNGGTVTFGPDGYLYLGLGDGGGIGDQHENAQDPATILGGIVRLDVDAADPYAVPPDNPFVDGGGAPEVWAYGLRNPWRTTIDPATDAMVIADVGQDQWEEINVVSLSDGGGTNFGWPVVAGPDCFHHPSDREDGVPAPDCDTDGFHTPTVSLDRDDGCAVIGGPVYRGAAIPELDGHYVYSDYCRGTVRSFPLDAAGAGGGADGAVEETVHLEDLGRITSVGTDHAGELYLTDQDGVLHRIDPVRG